MSLWGANRDFNNAVVNLFTYEIQQFKGSMNLNLGNTLKMLSMIIKALQANIELIFKHIHTTNYTDRFSNIPTMG